MSQYTAHQNTAHQYPAVYRCAVQSPLNRLFDYLPPENTPAQVLPGQRLRVPFGKRQVVAIVISVETQSEVAPAKMRSALGLIDESPLLSSEQLAFFSWIADYYHHPLGDTIFGFLPALLRKGRPTTEVAGSARERCWQLSIQGKGLCSADARPLAKRAPRQAQMLQLLQANGSVDTAELKAHGISTAVVRQLLDKGLIEQSTARLTARPIPSTAEQPPHANPEQAQAIAAVSASLGQYQCFLLYGVTGSGKTEVYLQLISQCLALGQQVLVLVPEIGLTPQMLQRFERRFGSQVLAMHSNLTDSQRHNAWLAAAAGEASILVGTRSALMTPLPKLGLLIVDEEHDSSFKQQDGLRYSARDLAIKRAQLANIPIVLGSATPSLESLANAAQGRYQLLEMQQRASGVAMPEIHITDCRESCADSGVSLEILQAARRHIEQGSQVLLFINRRGYAPALLCRQCGWVAQCSACDARLTAHLHGRRLICHHCEQTGQWPTKCSSCGAGELTTLGAGTQRLEQVLEQNFSDVPVVRVDRDSTQRKGELDNKLAIARSGQPCILVGTQMLAKGHHFPKLAMVAILDADAALYSSDFRGPERMAQTITQVAGRAGRGSQRGEVYIQSQLPQHPTLQAITQKPYLEFARFLLQERQALQLPPCQKAAALWGEHKNLQDLLDHMRSLAAQLESTLPATAVHGIQRVGPVPAAMVRKANRFRALLLVYSAQASPLHSYLSALREQLDGKRAPNGMRLAIDVDPIDTN